MPRKQGRGQERGRRGQPRDVSLNTVKPESNEATVSAESVGEIGFIDGGHLLTGDDSDIGTRIKPISVGSYSIVNFPNCKLLVPKMADMSECLACGYISRSRLELKAHIWEHGDNPLVFCNHEGCEMSFNIQCMFQHEVDHHHPKVILKCDISNVMFESKTMLIQHNEVHIKQEEKHMLLPEDDQMEFIDGGDLLDGDDSDTTTTSSIQVQAEHVVEVDENDEHRVDMDESNSNHEVLCEGDSPITDECELCLIKFNSESKLVSHLKKRHPHCLIKPYHCEFHGCNFTTHFRSILRKHNIQHSRKFKCKVCGKLSKNSVDHFCNRKIHQNGLFRCRYENCEAVYKSKIAYHVHVLSHSNEQPKFKCDFPQCKFVTGFKNSLKMHKVTHSNLLNFFCMYEGCKKGFKRKGELKIHITRHHNNNLMINESINDL